MVLGLSSVFCATVPFYSPSRHSHIWSIFELNGTGVKKKITGNTRVNHAVSKQNGYSGKGLYCVTLSGFENFILTMIFTQHLQRLFGCMPLKVHQSDQKKIKGTRYSWNASHPNPDLTYHYYFWLTASPASLSSLLSSKLNRKFSSPCFQDLTAHGLRKLAGRGTKL